MLAVVDSSAYKIEDVWIANGIEVGSHKLIRQGTLILQVSLIAVVSFGYHRCCLNVATS